MTTRLPIHEFVQSTAQIGNEEFVQLPIAQLDHRHQSRLPQDFSQLPTGKSAYF